MFQVVAVTDPPAVWGAFPRGPHRPLSREFTGSCSLRERLPLTTVLGDALCALILFLSKPLEKIPIDFNGSGADPVSHQLLINKLIVFN